MGRKTQTNSPGVWQSPPSWRAQEEVRVKDGHPGEGRQTESRVETTEGGAREETGGARVDQTEGGAREETGGTWSRRSQVGPRPQPWRWPTVEPTEGRGAAGGVESRGDRWSTTDKSGAGRTREPGRPGGLTGHGGEEGARSHGLAAGSTGRGGVRDSETGGGDKGSSSHDTDRDWQTRSDPTTQMVGWGWAEGLLDDSGGGGRSGRVGGHLWASGLVCAAHTHQIVTPSTRSHGLADSSGQTDKSEEGGRRMGMSAYISASQSIMSPESRGCSPSAVVQWAGLFSKPSRSLA